MPSLLLETNRFLFIMIAFAIIQSPLQKAMHLPHVNKPACHFEVMLTIQDPNYFWLWKAGNAFFIFLTIYFFITTLCVTLWE